MSAIITCLSLSLVSLMVVQAEAEPGYGHATSYVYRGVEGVHGHHGYGGYGYGKRSAAPGYGGYGQAYVYEDRVHGVTGHYGGYGYGKRSAAAEPGYGYGHATSYDYRIQGLQGHHGHGYGGY